MLLARLTQPVSCIHLKASPPSFLCVPIPISCLHRHYKGTAPGSNTRPLARIAEMSDPHFDRKAAQATFLDSIAKYAPLTTHLSSSDLCRSFNNPDSSPDLRIKCGGREWVCHKHILKRQSKWFQKAIDGEFKVNDNVLLCSLVLC